MFRKYFFHAPPVMRPKISNISKSFKSNSKSLIKFPEIFPDILTVKTTTKCSENIFFKIGWQKYIKLPRMPTFVAKWSQKARRGFSPIPRIILVFLGAQAFLRWLPFSRIKNANYLVKSTKKGVVTNHGSRTMFFLFFRATSDERRGKREERREKREER